ncbi:MAG TPA: alpha/beta fold hydrolase [Actinomycetota bacterium]|nr:alpha/beta fold hydrolase [Actinomycetota bacterium]
MAADAWVANPIDGTLIRYRDDGGPGVPVAVLGGFLDPIEVVGRTPIVSALPRDVLRLIWIDHRGHGGSDAPHDPAAYTTDLRGADVLAVLDAIELDRAAILGISWGGRLGFGVVDRAPARVRSLVTIGQHPYRLRDDGPLGRIVSAAMDASRTQGIVAIVEAFEGLAGRYPDEVRAAYLDEDAVAMRAAWTAALAEGPVADHLGSWDLPCCICVAAGDEDFAGDARRAAAEIPGARFVVIEGIDHLGVDTVRADPFLDAVLSTLRADRGT